VQAGGKQGASGRDDRGRTPDHEPEEFPVTDTLTAPLTDTRVMAVIHTLFRRELRLAGGLLRGVAAGDTARAAVVADHLDLVGGILHHHHTAEDDLLWPLLLERVHDELAPIVHLMESQHERAEQLLGEIAPLAAEWRRTARAAERDRMAHLYDELHVALAEHLDAEEQRLLPIAARTVTQEEWERMGAAARAGTPKDKQFVVLGMIAYDGGPAGIALLLAKAPAPVRWLLPRLGARAYRKHALAVYGTATP
jgi:iron-sulfur cluster repair protein YtfE (RIC family)